MSEATVDYELTLGFDVQDDTATAEKKRRKRPTREEIAQAVEQAEKIKARRRKKAEELTVPQRRVVIPDRIEQIWNDMELHTKDGFYEITERGSSRGRGVVGIAQSALGETEYRIPFESIKGLFRTQYVSDMQAAEPVILSSIFMVYTSEPVTFAYVNAEQFEILDKMLGSQVTRCYTYHDMADGKRGYTFNFPEFPSLDDQEEYRRSHAPVQRRQVDADGQEEAPAQPGPDDEPAVEAAAEDTAAD